MTEGKLLVLCVVLFTSLALASQATVYRSFDGTNNNPNNPSWGSAGSQLSRCGASAYYADGLSTVRKSVGGGDLLNPRLLSNEVLGLTTLAPLSDIRSDFVTYWGQFLDHDFDLTPGNDAEPLPIPVPKGDPIFDPTGTGTNTIPFGRSFYNTSTGTTAPRQQVTIVTSWIDASQIYGSDLSRVNPLRTFTDGLLNTTIVGGEEYLPRVGASGYAMLNPSKFVTDDKMYCTGDLRGNENPALIAIHVVFLREHNRLARLFKAENPTWNDETLFQEARRWIIAYVQKISFYDYATWIVGNFTDYTGYNDQSDPSICNVFSGCAFRYGHSEVRHIQSRVNEDRTPTAAGNIILDQNIFNPTSIEQEGVDPILRGLAYEYQELVDLHYVDDLRNYLFGGVTGSPNPKGIDLAATNLQRARDNGLPGYNDIRKAWGLPERTSWDQVSTNPEYVALLRKTFNNSALSEKQQLDDCDCYICGLAEDHPLNSNVGEMFRTIIRTQYTRIRDGDRFWFENPWANFTTQEVAAIRSTRFADIILRNTKIEKIQCNIFVAEKSNFGCSLNTATASSTAQTAATSAPTGTVWDVEVRSNFFKPAALTIAAGDTVKWTRYTGSHTCSYVDKNTDTLAPANGLWRYPADGIDNAEWTTFSYTFPTAGVYNYICEPHVFIGMRGNVTVTGPATTASTTAAGTTNSASSFSILPVIILSVFALIAKIVA